LVHNPGRGIAVIETRGLTKRFRRVVAVDDVSFTCRDGEVFGLLGPNGAGKTTLLRLIASVLEPTAGSALVDGLDARKQGEQVRARIGLLVETAGLYSRFTPREHLRFCGRLHGLDGSHLERRVNAVLGVLEIGDFADRRAEGFSAGMRRRVVLGQALVHDPPNVILDEPTASLDVMSTRNVRAIVRQFREDGRCVLISTHRMDEAQRLCDRVAIIHRGRLQAVGTPAELMTMVGVGTLEEALVHIVGEEQLRADLWERKRQRPWYRLRSWLQPKRANQPSEHGRDGADA
jgi:sodium transport system ATP-binding protein